MKIESFFDKNTYTISHIVIDEDSKKCAIIDSVLDYDQFSGKVSTKSADLLIDYIKQNELTNEWILETHIHADHITASGYIKEKIGGKIAVGSGIKEVLKFWVKEFDDYENTPISGSQFDVIFNDGDFFKIGNIDVEVMFVAGHTPACTSYIAEDCVFVGDTIFAPNLGTARCDFPGGSAKQLYNSIQKFYQMPDDTKLYLCHDYPEGDNKPYIFVTVLEQKENNKMINQNVSEEEYITKREARDKNLAVPKLLYPAIQMNMRSGRLGLENSSGKHYMKIPITFENNK